jgi:apolipoprotein N-acyltransferase
MTQIAIGCVIVPVQMVWRQPVTTLTITACLPLMFGASAFLSGEDWIGIVFAAATGFAWFAGAMLSMVVTVGIVTGILFRIATWRTERVWRAGSTRRHRYYVQRWGDDGKRKPKTR